MSPDSFLTTEMQLRAGALSIHAQFALSEPWTVLFGPSGSGKTTVLRTIAGFVRPDAGRIVLGEKILVDDASGVFVLPYERPIRTAGQMARLFPHRTVRWNTMYGSGWASNQADKVEIGQATMKLFRLTELADRMPRDLSGGERQRASVARAVVSAVTYDGPGSPLLLLDEPFSGLDNAMRDELLVELQKWLQRWRIPVLSVTHSVGEAFQLGATVIKIAEGRIVQQGPVGEVLADERNRLMEQLGVEQLNGLN